AALQTSGSFPVSHGQTTASLTVGPPGPGDFSCPSGQTLFLQSVTYSNTFVSDQFGTTAHATPDPISSGTLHTPVPCHRNRPFTTPQGHPKGVPALILTPAADTNAPCRYATNSAEGRRMATRADIERASGMDAQIRRVRVGNPGTTESPPQ